MASGFPGIVLGEGQGILHAFGHTWAAGFQEEDDSGSSLYQLAVQGGSDFSVSEPDHVPHL